MDPNYDPPPTSLNPAASVCRDLIDRIAEMGIIRPGDTLMSEPERLRVKLADEKAAHATTRANFAEHVGVEFPAVGRCGASAADVFPYTRRKSCELPAGHAGWHKDAGAEWTPDLPTEPIPGLTDAEKAGFLAADAELNGPAGLSADQHIRALALSHAINWFAGDDASDEVDYVLSVAVKFAALIRDGEVPDDAG